MNIPLSAHFNYKKLLRLTFPSMAMLVATSLYIVVDGFFISNFAGKAPFAAVNFIMPVLIIVDSVGFMMGTGGGALIAKLMGERNDEKANKIFSMVVYLSFAAGMALAVGGVVFLRAIASFLGAEGALLENCVRYGRVILLGTPACILQFEFQCLFATANKPGLGFAITVVSGLTNVLLDALFVAILPWGLKGAAVATVIGQCVGGFLPVIYFARKNNSLLRLGKFYYHGKELFQVCLNGSSELLSNISSSFVGMLYNIQLLKYIGEDGVAAYGALMYVGMIFNAIFIGFSVGVAPVISYHYGAKNADELRSLKKKCLVIASCMAVTMFTLSLVLSKPLSSVFVGYDKSLFDLTVKAFLVYSLSFLFFVYTIFISSFFTALNNGLTSAAVSFLRTLVFQTTSILLLPLLWNVDGIWWSTVVAEVLAASASLTFLKAFKKKYNY